MKFGVLTGIVAAGVISSIATSASAQGVLNVYCSVQVEWCTLIANAVFHATGRRLRELPIRLEALL